MASEITDHDQNPSPGHDDGASNNGTIGGDINRGIKRQRPSALDDDDDDEDKPGNNRERRKIEIKFIQDKSRRHITFSKRKAGIMKKAYELSVLTGTQVLLLVVSETGLVYTFTTPKLQPLVTKPEGKNLIQACLNAPEPATGNEGELGAEPTVDSPDESAHVQMAGRPANMQPANAAMNAQYMSPEQALQYQNYLQHQQQQQAAQANTYPIPTQARMATHQAHPAHQ
ncbi:SRF-TF-domain-containing protein [Trichodelitschia bisporula]|uniref:SRF-TF-domain-containing protein n=1 Tax=Trichodelitschia bisporula TaxID=703511 RepID=A0A6G1I7S7_9PEZI|nr:SRF-TF-domain-containing protein [Trichodelitschia bisporula]